MTEQQLRDIRELVEKATPGAWIRTGYSIRTGFYPGDVIAVLEGGSPEYIRDGDFIAHARTDIALLLQELDYRDNLIADLQRDYGSVDQASLPPSQVREENRRLWEAIESLGMSVVDSVVDALARNTKTFFTLTTPPEAPATNA